MTEPQRQTLVISGAAIVIACLVLFLILFGLHALDMKGILLVVGFFAMATKVATVKHKHNPMI